MKIEELSIGDWVCAKQTKWEDTDPEMTPPMRVVVIDNREPKNAYVDLTFGDGSISHSAFIEDLQPVPLTAEILRANGWECIAVGDNGPSTPKQHYNRYEKWRCETKWGYREMFFDRMTKMWRFSGMNSINFTEVHKLQHAIRFSGFYNYEIEKMPCTTK